MNVSTIYVTDGRHDGAVVSIAPTREIMAPGLYFDLIKLIFNK